MADLAVEPRVPGVTANSLLGEGRLIRHLPPVEVEQCGGKGIPLGGTP
jgi:hypothetical protein